MRVEIRHLTKTFGAYTALDEVSLDVARRRVLRPARSLRLGQDHAAAHHRRPRVPRSGRGPLRRRGRGPARRARAPGRLRLPALRAVPPHERVRERRLRPARAAAPGAPGRGPDPRAGDGAAAPGPARAPRRAATRTSSPAASASAWRSPARSRSSRASCCSTSRSARSTPRCGRTCAAGCATCTGGSA